ncbi:MAG TPA: DUF4136 domain-containing protein [Steroidobacteraceae bacterium]|nr:DUF4136 domain-containing protein [Steroidobacteraceae bacterium]
MSIGHKSPTPRTAHGRFLFGLVCLVPIALALISCETLRVGSDYDPTADGPRWWGYRYWGTGVDVHRYREGTLAIDMFDAKTHKPVWHGWAKKPLTRRDLEHSDVSIPEAIDAVLATFPPH